MSRNYKFWDQEKPYFITFATVQWVDVFTRRIYKNILIDSLQYCIDNKGLVIHAWCIMSNHVHLIIGTRQEKMQHIVRDMKKFASKQIFEKISTNPQESRKEWMMRIFKEAGKQNGNNKNIQFWQQHNHPVELYNAKLIDQKVDYIHQNPVKAGWVHKPQHYIYSSAPDYAGKGNGLLIIEKIL